MSVFKRGQTWWFHFVFNGEHVQKSTKQSNKAVARQIESAYRTKLAKGEVGLVEPKVIPKFPDAVSQFLAHSASEHRAHPGTSKRYRASSVAPLRFFKAVPIDKITSGDIERFKMSRYSEKGIRTKRPLRPATVNRELALLRAVFGFWVKVGAVVANPVSRVKFLAEDNEQTRVVSFGEQEIYLAAAHQPLTDIASLMFETGARPNEIYRIRVEDVHIEEGYWFIPSGKTRAARRKVPLNQTAMAVLIRRIGDAENEYLFAARNGKPVRDVDMAHRIALRRSGVATFRLYDCRHTWATRAAMAGVDLITLAALLGHARIAMVQRYAHPSEQHQSNAMRQLEAFTINARSATLAVN